MDEDPSIQVFGYSLAQFGIVFSSVFCLRVGYHPPYKSMIGNFKWDKMIMCEMCSLKPRVNNPCFFGGGIPGYHTANVHNVPGFSPRPAGQERDCRLHGFDLCGQKGHSDGQWVTKEGCTATSVVQGARALRLPRGFGQGENVGYCLNWQDW